MKINSTVPNIETSGGMEEKLFSIGDSGMIFDILRGKMYSNPILAICREYSCNALDSHREAGVPDKPISIYLPNNLEPYYKIKDEGVGISPDRIENIFIKYGTSTKRNDNTQIGGFGLGAKCSFAYSDSFSIVTNYDGMQYNYSCFIDETKVGKLVLLSSSTTKEANGTEIIIPVNPKNFNEFNSFTEQACRHWKVKPLIKGGRIDWKTFNIALEGNGWKLSKKTNNNYYDRAAKAIIDGIEYPIDYTTLQKYVSTKIIDTCNGELLIDFGVGELTLAANREQIYWDTNTQHKMKVRFEEIKKDITKVINEQVATCTNLFNANVMVASELSHIVNNINELDITWNGIKVAKDGCLSTECTIYSFHRSSYYSRDGGKKERINCHQVNRLLFSKNSEIYINDFDLPKPTAKHVKKAFDDNATLNDIQLVCPDATKTIDVLNAKFHLDAMEPKLLSSITDPPKPIRTRTSPDYKLTIFRFNESFSHVPLYEFRDDKKHKVLCMLQKNNAGRRYVEIGNKFLNNDFFSTLNSNFPDISFYGVDESIPKERIEKVFINSESLNDFVEREFKNKNKFIEIKSALAYSSDIWSSYFDKWEEFIENKDGDFMKVMNMKNKMIQICNNKKLKSLVYLYEKLVETITNEEIDNFKILNPEFSMDVTNDILFAKYPLLSEMRSYNVNSDSCKNIAHYVNLVDKISGDSNVKK